MRGDDKQQAAMFSYVTMEQRIAPDHPMRRIRLLVDRALARMDAEFDRLYSEMGRPSIAPERLVRAQLLMVLYSIRSEGQLMEQLNYNLLYRWFVGLEMDDPVWDQTVLCKNRERLIGGDASQKLLLAVVEEAHGEQLLSEEHFTVDGTLIQAWRVGAASRRRGSCRIVAQGRVAASFCATRMSRRLIRRRGCIARAARVPWYPVIWAM